jgi:hypothetical protein
MLDTNEFLATRTSAPPCQDSLAEFLAGYLFTELQAVVADWQAQAPGLDLDLGVLGVPADAWDEIQAETQVIPSFCGVCRVKILRAPRVTLRLHRAH